MKTQYLHFLIFSFLILSCGSSKKNKELLISFSADSAAIVISGIEKVGLNYLRNNIDSLSDQELVFVAQTPNDDEINGKEILCSGKLKLVGDSLIFLPDQPFVKNENYLVQTVIGSNFASIEDMIKGKVGNQINYQQKLLKR